MVAAIWNQVPTRKQITFVLFVVLVLPLIAVLAWAFVLQPLKYNYLIWRVESARTATDEMAAFRLAADWGRVWEVNRIRPEDLSSTHRNLAGDGDWLLQLEWLPASPFGGGAYTACRSVIDTNNLRILVGKRY